jgi:hypothetical protein
MPESKKIRERETKKPAQSSDRLNAWGRDQQKHSYYYDDSHGYQRYDPEADEDAPCVEGDDDSSDSDSV